MDNYLQSFNFSKDLIMNEELLSQFIKAFGEHPQNYLSLPFPVQLRETSFLPAFASKPRNVILVDCFIDAMFSKIKSNDISSNRTIDSRGALEKEYFERALILVQSHFPRKKLESSFKIFTQNKLPVQKIEISKELFLLAAILIVLEVNSLTASICSIKDMLLSAIPISRQREGLIPYLDALFVGCQNAIVHLPSFEASRSENSYPLIFPLTENILRCGAQCRCDKLNKGNSCEAPLSDGKNATGRWLFKIKKESELPKDEIEKLRIVQFSAELTFLLVKYNLHQNHYPTFLLNEMTHPGTLTEQNTQSVGGMEVIWEAVEEMKKKIKVAESSLEEKENKAKEGDEKGCITTIEAVKAAYPSLASLIDELIEQYLVNDGKSPSESSSLSSSLDLINPFIYCMKNCACDAWLPVNALPWTAVESDEKAKNAICSCESARDCGATEFHWPAIPQKSEEKQDECSFFFLDGTCVYKVEALKEACDKCTEEKQEKTSSEEQKQSSSCCCSENEAFPLSSGICVAPLSLLKLVSKKISEFSEWNQKLADISSSSSPSSSSSASSASSSTSSFSSTLHSHVYSLCQTLTKEEPDLNSIRSDVNALSHMFDKILPSERQKPGFFDSLRELRAAVNALRLPSCVCARGNDCSGKEGEGKAEKEEKENGKQHESEAIKKGSESLAFLLRPTPPPSSFLPVSLSASSSLNSESLSLAQPSSTEPTNPPKIALVTGAAGFIGAWVCHRLLMSGVAVIAADSLNDFYSSSIKEHAIARLEEVARAVGGKRWKEEKGEGEKKEEASEDSNGTEVISLLTNFVFIYHDLRDKEGFRAKVEKAYRLVTGVKCPVSEDKASGDSSQTHSESKVKVHIPYVIHLAARAGVRSSMLYPELFRSENVLATRNIFELAVGKVSNGKRGEGWCTQSIVYASSSSVYGKMKDGLCAEHLCVGPPECIYADTKVENERQAAEYMSKLTHTPMISTTAPPSPPVSTYIPSSVLAHSPIPPVFTGLRFFTVDGDMLGSSAIGRVDMAIPCFTRMLHSEGKEKVTMYGDGSFRRDYTNVRDIVDGICLSLDRADRLREQMKKEKELALSKEKGGEASSTSASALSGSSSITVEELLRVFNLGEDHSTSVRQLIVQLAKEMGMFSKETFAAIKEKVKHEVTEEDLLQYLLEREYVASVKPPPGDIPICITSLERSRSELLYSPKFSVEENLHACIHDSVNERVFESSIFAHRQASCNVKGKGSESQCVKNCSCSAGESTELSKQPSNCTPLNCLLITLASQKSVFSSHLLNQINLFLSLPLPQQTTLLSPFLLRFGLNTHQTKPSQNEPTFLPIPELTAIEEHTLLGWDGKHVEVLGEGGSEEEKAEDGQLSYSKLLQKIGKGKARGSYGGAGLFYLNPLFVPGEEKEGEKKKGASQSEIDYLSSRTNEGANTEKSASLFLDKAHLFTLGDFVLLACVFEQLWVECNAIEGNVAGETKQALLEMVVEAFSRMLLLIYQVANK
ncbi:putative NAD dependent epimerase [Monocercomonoides exilis]|uniref:putative NAD dependent epimerase n=1 Tax=Monocercomonoides exilis TaxID=2049356 RepID=UPI00355A1539|nr:putative NAD dependent epimerase [Monocercomonoides exilis]|eukprot:MONOS_696.1-p1 / transcript=MONOS_696.1 / gene=MONOS_696 / organism=Monocercomonoides_exilis_PA203 / gene_product=NAD dependent epimerase / transcript_product=NAD dependent epimerase / location=Mono_scaffold00011:221426-226632(-) / protein_length=1495 / sequence_SO=supercontig / SO=protein_coding / is_pseudo=false